MTRKLNTLKLLLSICLATLFFACSNNKTTTNESQTDSAAIDQMAETNKPLIGPTVPFNAVVIRHTVADYDKWRPFFDSDSTARKESGLRLIGLARGIENQNEIDIPFMIDDLAKAKSFAFNPRLKEVMQKGGVTSAPNIKFINVLRMSEAIQKKGDFLEIALKVKDFDTWLKVFDNEGAEIRMKDGIEDGVLARGIDDPNLAYLVFKISDIEKAKAAMNNPARQKLIQESGVIGKPEMYFGRDQQ